jgi:hypothetical protein
MKTSNETEIYTNLSFFEITFRRLIGIVKDRKREGAERGKDRKRGGREREGRGQKKR